MDAGAMEQLRKDGYEVIEQFYEPDQLGAALRDFDVVIIRSATKIKEPQIDAAAGSIITFRVSNDLWASSGPASV